MSVVKGRDVILYFTYNGLDQVVCCFQSCTLNTITNFGETSTINSGKWRSFKPLSLEWDGTCEGLISLDSNISIGQLREVQNELQTIAIQYVTTDSNGLQEFFSSTCILTQITTNSSFSGTANYSVSIKGIGEIANTLPPGIPEGCILTWLFLNAAGGGFTTGANPELVGNDIDGVIYRDGVAYRPSGVAHDGSGTPVGKEFSIDPLTGEIGFDTSLPPLEAGEQINIPYLVCDTGGGGGTCDGVVITPTTLPDANLGIPYIQNIPFTGDTPVSIAPGAIKPTWMTLTVNNGTMVVELRGTPSTTGTNLQVSFTLTNCDGVNSDAFSDSIDVVDVPPMGALLSFRYVLAINEWSIFLNTAVDADIDITKIFSDGFSDGVCSIGAGVSSAQNNSLNTITAGATAITVVPEISTGVWASAIRFSVYNVIVNGTPVVNGNVLTIGSFLVTMDIPSCSA